MSGILPPDEHDRLQRVYALNLLDKSADAHFRCIIRLAQTMLKVPTVALAMVDRHRLYFLASEGIPVAEMPRELSICAHTILSSELQMVSDTREDPRFRNLPSVQNPPHLRSYLGIALMASAGVSGVGTLCVLDSQVRVFSLEEQRVLRDLALLAERELRLRFVESAWQASTQAQFLIDNEGCIRHCNPAAERLVGYPESALLQFNLGQLLHPDDRATLRSLREQRGQLGQRSSIRSMRLLQREGEPRKIALELLAVPQLPRVHLCQMWEQHELQRLTERIQAERPFREPVSLPSAPQTLEKTAPPPESTLPHPPSSGEHVLLVEDAPRNAELATTPPVEVPLPSATISLDILGALRRLRGDMSQLRLLLRRFVQRYEQEVATWSKPERISDPTFLRARLHDIKGASHTLGLQSLGALAAHLEQRLKDGIAISLQELEGFQAHLRETHQYLEREGLLEEG